MKNPGGRIVPVMNTPTAMPTTDANRSNPEEEMDVEDALVDNLRIDRQTNRAIGKNSKGKLQIPRTGCWDRFYNMPLQHLVQCGHVVQTKVAVACGVNCRLAPTAKRTPHGPGINCKRCLEKKNVSPFIPKKRARKTSMRAREPEKIVADEGVPLFVKPDDDENSDEVLRKQLAIANYPGHGASKNATVMFEPLPPPNPRKRKTADDPTFDLFDYPTSEPPRRRSSIQPPVEDENAQVHFDTMLVEPELHCMCQAAKDDDMLVCTACKKFFHPECVGYGDLSNLQYLQYEMGVRDFICETCKEDRAELAYRRQEHKKAKRVERGLNKKSTGALYSEIKKSFNGRLDAKQKHKEMQKQDVLRGKKTSKGRDSVTDKGQQRAAEDRMEVETFITTSGAAPRRRTSAPPPPPPPPPQRRFSLSRNKFDRAKDRENLESAEMDIDE